MSRAGGAEPGRAFRLRARRLPAEEAEGAVKEAVEEAEDEEKEEGRGRIPSCLLRRRSSGARRLRG